jgi:hypothetical protein
MKKLITVVVISLFTVCTFAQMNSDKYGFNESKTLSLKSRLSSPYALTDTKAKKKNDFKVTANFYIWGTSLSGTAALPIENSLSGVTQTPVVDVSMSFSDAVKYLKMALMLAGKFIYKDWGLMYDVAYVSLENNATVPAESHVTSANMKVKMLNGDFTLLRNFPLKDKTTIFSVFAGARLLSMDNTVSIVYTDNSTNTNNKTTAIVDPIIGGDVSFDFSKHWFIYAKTAFGGFGISSKYTGLYAFTTGYKFSEHWNTSIGFKYLYTNYDKNNLLWKMTQYGLLLSVGCIF